MKKIFTLLYCLVCVFILAACNSQNETIAESLGTLPTVSNISSIDTSILDNTTVPSTTLNNNENQFTLSTNISNCVIDNNVISFKVSQDTSSYSFINIFNIPPQYKWELHYDKECLPSLNIVSKTVDLVEGENLLYALFINKNNADDVYFYEIKLHRDSPSVEELYQQAIESLMDYVNDLFVESPNNYITPNHAIEYLHNVKGYSEDIAIYAAENCNINWNLQAQQYIQEYLIYKEEWGQPATWFYSFDIEDMLYEADFSFSVIEMTMSNIDWTLQASKYLKHLSEFYNEFDRVRARSILEEISANEYGTTYLLENSSIDWKMHAYNITKSLLERDPNYPLDELINDLSNQEFTEEEIEYAMNLLY